MPWYTGIAGDVDMNPVGAQGVGWTVFGPHVSETFRQGTLAGAVRRRAAGAAVMDQFAAPEVRVY